MAAGASKLTVETSVTTPVPTGPDETAPKDVAESVEKKFLDLGAAASIRVTSALAEGHEYPGDVHTSGIAAVGASQSAGGTCPADALVRAAYYAVGFHNAGLDAEIDGVALGEGTDRRAPLLKEGPALKSPPENLRFAVARMSDCDALEALVRKLADFEKAPDEVETTAETFRRDGFGPCPAFAVILALLPDDHPAAEGAPKRPSGKGMAVVGFSLFHFVYSTWAGRSAYLEDLYLMPPARRLGIGTRLIAATTTAAFVASCKRIAWIALDWNENALNAYQRMGARRMDDWILLRFEGETLRKVAGAKN